MNICPRCEAAIVGDGREALSRLTRDDGSEVYVCQRCGEREALYGREPDHFYAITMQAWPLSVDQIVAEERELIERFRGGRFQLIPTNRLGA